MLGLEHANDSRSKFALSTPYAHIDDIPNGGIVMLSWKNSEDYWILMGINPKIVTGTWEISNPSADTLYMNADGLQSVTVFLQGAHFVCGR